MTEIIHKELSYIIQGCVFEVFKVLGPIWSESAYEKALLIALKQKGVTVESQINFIIVFKGHRIGLYRSDLLVEDKIIIEVKRVPELLPLHTAQVISYLKITGKDLGLLANFGGELATIKRIPNFISDQSVEVVRFELPKNYLYRDTCVELLKIAGEVHQVLGPGYFHQVYRSAVRLELKSQGIKFDTVKQISAIFLDQLLEEKAVRFFIISDKILLSTVAVKELDDTYLAKFGYYVKHFDLPLGLLINFNSTKLNFRFYRNPKY